MDLLEKNIEWVVLLIDSAVVATLVWVLIDTMKKVKNKERGTI